MRCKYHIVGLLLIFATMLLGSCRGADSDPRPVLCVSIEPQRNMVEQLAGEGYRVVTMMSNGANPETFEPTMSQRMAMADAAVYFSLGQLPFEATLASAIKPGTLLVDTSKGINMATGTHSHGDHEHEATDPHIWTSLQNGRLMAANITQALKQIDPDNSADYNARYQRLVHRLDSINAATAKALADANVHAFAVWHPSLTYYARDYGLHQIAVGQESKEMSLSNLRDVINEARNDSVKVFFFQKEYDSRQASSINNEIGSTLVTINPLEYDWENQIKLITDALTH